MARRLLPGVLKRALSTGRQGGHSAVRSTAQGGGSTNAGARRFLKLSGFSRHASRQDLLSVLEQSDFPLDSIRSIDAIIKPGMLPSDTYVVEFDSQAKLDNIGIDGVAVQASGLDYLRQRWLTEEEVKREDLGTKLGVSECAVRVGNVPASVEKDEIFFLFQDFDLAPDGITQLPPEVANRRQHGPQSTAFILHFTSPDEAQRAVREKQHCEIAEKRISIVAYR